MNSTERLVEAYYIQKGHFTLSDVKVARGNNRQFDLLTFDTISKDFYHIEISVTHALNWQRNLQAISWEMGFKFFGNAKNKRPNNPNTDFNKNKSYIESIKSTYTRFGIDYEKVNRVWCTWHLPESEKLNIDKWRISMSEKHSIEPNRFDILFFRDQVLSTLLENIGTSNYDDELLRALSLIKEHKRQTSP